MRAPQRVQGSSVSAGVIRQVVNDQPRSNDATAALYVRGLPSLG